jgi:hypothetical protein
MNCFSFQVRFVEPILAGTKDQTIRAPRKSPPKIGGSMHLFTGMRTKACRRIATVTCTEILSCELSPFLYGGFVRITAGNDNVVHLNGKRELVLFARRDGFASWEALCEFWADTHGSLAFHGTIYRWEALRP